MIEIGRLLNQAKDSLQHGEFLKMIEGELPFSRSTAARFMKISGDRRIVANVQHLPAAWGTMYELTKLDDVTFEARLAAGKIHPDMARGDLMVALKEERRAAHAARTLNGGTVENLHQLANFGFKGILADPPWQFTTRSELGEGRSANQHYRTEGLDRIKQLPVEQLAADDAVLFMWMPDWLVQGALEVVEAWGFKHRTTGFTWAKQNPSGEGWHMGKGFWSRSNPEVCWLCTRGNPKRLYEDVRQLIVAPVMEHSRKPDEIYDGIERLVEGPYLELFARRERPGWASWGNELPFAMPLPPHDPETGEIIDAKTAEVAA
jgi:N6-adenosine-specific RNA methylase IME4